MGRTTQRRGWVRTTEASCGSILPLMPPGRGGVQVELWHQRESGLDQESSVGSLHIPDPHPCPHHRKPPVISRSSLRHRRQLLPGRGQTARALSEDKCLNAHRRGWRRGGEGSLKHQLWVCMRCVCARQQVLPSLALNADRASCNFAPAQPPRTPANWQNTAPHLCLGMLSET